MRRDPDLMRKLILAVEAEVDTDSIEGYDLKQIGYHAYLAVDARLANGIDMTTIEDTLPQWQITHLTWAGHDFADAARDETMWTKARARIASVGGSVSFDVLKDLLVAIAKNAVGLD